jgi:hypothetical protein
MKKLLFYIGLVNLLGNGVNAAPLYQCVDEEGNIQYTQIPAAGCSEIKVSTIQSVTTPIEPNSAMEVSTNDAIQVEDSANHEVETKSSAPQTVEEGCKIAMEKLRKLESNLALAKPDKDNPTKFIPLTDDMRQQERAQAKEYMDMFCQGRDASE